MNKSIYSSEHKKIINKLVKARLDSGLSQNDAAKKLGKSQSYISKLESGQRRVDLIQLKALAKIYKITLDSLI